VTKPTNDSIRAHNDSRDLDVLLPKNTVYSRDFEREVLTPKSTRWGLFTDALDIVLQERGCSNDSGMNTLRPELTHAAARAVMNQMEYVDINRSLVFFQEHGGMCDCEILMNVDKGEPPGEDGECLADEDEDRDFATGAKALADKALGSLQWLPMLSETHPTLFKADGSFDFDKFSELSLAIDKAVSDNVVPLKPS
jgi:hypothetical protein